MIGGTWFWDKNQIIATRVSEYDGVTWNGISSSSHTCYIPTWSQNIVFNNSNINTCNVETDKLVDNWTINGGHLDVLEYFSDSIKTMTLNNGASVNTMQGSPQNTVCNNSTIGNIAFGNTYGGGNETFVGTNCHFTGNITINFSNNGACTNDGSGLQPSYCGLPLNGSGQLDFGGSSTPHSGWCLSYDLAWWLPGTKMIYGGDAGRYVGFPWTVGDNTFTGLNDGDFCGQLLVQTTMTSLPPAAISAINHAPVAIPDNQRNWQCSNCTGTRQAIDWSQAPAQNQPLWTYSNSTFTCTANLANVPGSFDFNNTQVYYPFGMFTSLSINVTRADTGPLPSVNWVQFGFARFTNQTTGVTQLLVEQVNLKTTGLRTVTTPSATGAQGGDILNAPGGGGATQWLQGEGTVGNNGGIIDQDLSNEPAAQCPVFTLTWQASR
jgi:hypothetical protein